METKNIIVFASTKKEAQQTIDKDYTGAKFHSVYKYSRGKGNNFYKYTL